MSILEKPRTSIVASLMADANKEPYRREEIVKKILAKEVERRDLALAAHAGSEEARAKRAQLKQEIVELNEEREDSEIVEQQLRALLADEKTKENEREDTLLREKITRQVHGQITFAKDVERSIAIFATGLAKLLENASAPLTAWRGTWPPSGGALLYEKRIGELVGHELFIRLREVGVKMPEIKYTETDWPGLTKRFQEAARWTKATLVDRQPATPGPVAAEAPAPQPTAAPEPYDEHNPENFPLSGREWNRITEEAERGKATKVAKGTEFNVFTGAPMAEEIDPSTL